MKLIYHYRIAIIYPFIFTLFSASIFNLIGKIGYKTEWLSIQGSFGQIMWFTIASSMIIAGLSLTIFLHKYKWVKKNRLWSLLSWFLLPFLWFSYIFTEMMRGVINNKPPSASNLIYYSLLITPFIIGLVWSYYHYSKMISRARIRKRTP